MEPGRQRPHGRPGLGRRRHRRPVEQEGCIQWLLLLVVERIAGKGGGKGAVLPSFLSRLLLVDFPGKKQETKETFFLQKEKHKSTRDKTL